MGYEMYVERVKFYFKGMMKKLTQEEVDDYFEKEETQEIIKENYEVYKDRTIVGIAPLSTAWSLCMFY